MVLEYAESGCLSDYLYNKKKLKEDEAFKYNYNIKFTF